MRGDSPHQLLATCVGHGVLLDTVPRIYVIGVLMLGTPLVCHALQLARDRSDSSARRLLLASIVYLPALLLLLMMAEKTWPAISVFARLSTHSG
jgi:heme O synthase-like polyprenyltransferase